MDGLRRMTVLRATVAAVLLMLFVQLASAYPNPSPQGREKGDVRELLQFGKRQEPDIATVPAEADEPMAQTVFAEMTDTGDLVMSRGPVDPLEGDDPPMDDGTGDDGPMGNADGPALTDSIPSPSAYAAQTDVPSTADAGGDGPIIEASRGQPLQSGYPDVTNLALPGPGLEASSPQPLQTGAPGLNVSKNGSEPAAARTQPSQTNESEPEVSDDSSGLGASLNPPSPTAPPGPDVSRDSPAADETAESQVGVARPDSLEPFVAIPAPIDFGPQLPAAAENDDQGDIATEDALNMTQTSFGRFRGVQPTLRTLIKKRTVLVTSAAPVLVTKIQYVIALTQAGAPGVPASVPAFLRNQKDNGDNDAENNPEDNGEYIPVFSGTGKSTEASEPVDPSMGGEAHNQPATASGYMNLPILTGDWNDTTTTADEMVSSDWFMMHKPTSTITITIGPHGELPSGIPPEISSAISAALGNGLTAFPWSDEDTSKSGSGSESDSKTDAESGSAATAASPASAKGDGIAAAPLTPAPAAPTPLDSPALADSVDLPDVDLNNVQPDVLDQPFQAKLLGILENISFLMNQ